MAFNDEMSTPPVAGAASDPAAAAAAELRQAGMPEHDIIKTLLAKGFLPQEILAATGGGVASADATAGIEQPTPVDDPGAMDDSGGDQMPPADVMSPAGTPETPPPASVRDAVSRETDPLAGMRDELNAAPASAKPEVTVTEPPGGNKLVESPGSLGKILGLLSPDSAFGQGLMAAGFGALGARGTYGNTGAAIGQGGLYGVQAYQQAKKEQDDQATRKLAITSADARAAAKNKLDQSSADQKASAADRKYALDKAKALIEVAKNGDVEGARKEWASDPLVMKYWAGPEGAMQLTQGKMTLDDLKVMRVMAMPVAEGNKALFREKDASDKPPTKAQIEGDIEDRIIHPNSPRAKAKPVTDLERNAVVKVDPFYDKAVAWSKTMQGMMALTSLPSDEERDAAIQGYADKLRSLQKGRSGGGDFGSVTYPGARIEARGATPRADTETPAKPATPSGGMTVGDYQKRRQQLSGGGGG